MSKPKTRKRWFALLIVLLSPILLYVLSKTVIFFRASPYYDFPIPLHAWETKDPETGHSYYELFPSMSGIQYGIYKKEIEANGWKLVDRMGTAHFYEKDGKKLLVIIDFDSISIIAKKAPKP